MTMFMTQEELNKLGEVLVAKMKVINLAKMQGLYSKNIREYPPFSEFEGMLHVLKIMNIDFEIMWNGSSTLMVGIKIKDCYFEV